MPFLNVCSDKRPILSGVVSDITEGHLSDLNFGSAFLFRFLDFIYGHNSLNCIFRLTSRLFTVDSSKIQNTQNCSSIGLNDV